MPNCYKFAAKRCSALSKITFPIQLQLQQVVAPGLAQGRRRVFFEILWLKKNSNAVVSVML